MKLITPKKKIKNNKLYLLNIKFNINILLIYY